MIWLRIGIVYGMLAVIAGAFGAHGLKGQLSVAQMDVFETAVRYQMYHSLLLLILWSMMRSRYSRLLNWSGGLISIGTLLFSGSIYGLVLTNSVWLGPVTPLGGLCLILGWGCLLVASYKWKTKRMGS